MFVWQVCCRDLSFLFVRSISGEYHPQRVVLLNTGCKFEVTTFNFVFACACQHYKIIKHIYFASK